MTLQQPLKVLVRTHITYSWLETAIYIGTIPEDAYWVPLGCYPNSYLQEAGVAKCQGSSRWVGLMFPNGCGFKKGFKARIRFRVLLYEME